MKEMMAESATLVGDGGGIVTTFPEPMVGGERIAQLLFAGTLRPEQQQRLELVADQWPLGRAALLWR